MERDDGFDDQLQPENGPGDDHAGSATGGEGADDMSVPEQLWTLPTVPDGVAANIRRLSPRRGERVLSHLRTAAFLIPLIDSAEPGVRLSESVAYNIREALDSTVNDVDAGGGGLGAVHDAWAAVEAAEQESSEATAAAVEHLHAVIKRSTDRKEREGFRSRQLLQHFRSNTGVEPFSESGSMVARFNGLRGRAAGSLHGELSAVDAANLYRETVDWLSWMFLAPDQRAAEIAVLAAEVYTGADQIGRVRELCADPLQLGRFLALLSDPDWLEPLLSARLVGLPNLAAAVWPVDQLGLLRTDPEAAASLMGTLVRHLKQHPVVDERAAMAFSIFRVASGLGDAGLPVLEKLLSAYGSTSRGIRAMGIDVIRRGDPTRRIVEQVARLVLQAHERHVGQDNDVATSLAALDAGVTAENVRGRVTLTAHGLQAVADANAYRYLDTVPFSVAPQRGRDIRRLVANRLVGLANRGRQLGVSTTELLGCVSPVAGDLGSRLTSQLLTTATDIDLQERIGHVAARIQTDPTGDDRDLVASILSQTSDDTRAQAVDAWTTALGEPPGPDAEPADPTLSSTRDARVWRWMGVLPDECFNRWSERVARLIAVHGPGNPSRFDIPKEDLHWRQEDRSPIAVDELVSLAPEDAAARVAAWTPTDDSDDTEEARHDLARAFGAASEKQLDEWVAHSNAIVNILDAPLPIVHFLRAVALSGDPVRANAHAVLAAVTTVVDKMREGAWPDAGQNHVRSSLLGHVAGLVVKLANNDSATWSAEQFSTLWAHATTHALTTSDEYVRSGDFGDDQTPYAAAINQPWGQNLEAVLALSARAYRATQAAPNELAACLDRVAAVAGDAGHELHAVLVDRLPLLDTLVPEWVDSHLEYLTPSTTDGNPTLAGMIARNQPSSRLLDRYRERMLDIVRKHPEPVVYWLLVGTFWQHPGYTIDAILQAVGSSETAAGELCQQTAFLVQDAPADSVVLTAATGHWRTIIDRPNVPNGALQKLGHWAFVENIDANRWMTLMLDTVARTGGVIDNPGDAADRWRTDGNPAEAMPLLLVLLGHGDSWEQATVLDSAVDCLRAVAVTTPVSEPVRGDFVRLRDALLDRGRYDIPALASTPET